LNFNDFIKKIGKGCFLNYWNNSAVLVKRISSSSQDLERMFAGDPFFMIEGNLGEK